MKNNSIPTNLVGPSAGGHDMGRGVAPLHRRGFNALQMGRERADYSGAWREYVPGVCREQTPGDYSRGVASQTSQSWVDLAANYSPGP